MAEGRSSGRIVNISLDLGTTGRHGSGGLWRLEGRHHQPHPDHGHGAGTAHGITVNAIAPGPTLVQPPGPTAPKQREAFLSRMALKKYATPADIAAAAAFLASPDASHITGHVLNVDGGFAAAGVLFDPSEF